MEHWQDVFSATSVDGKVNAFHQTVECILDQCAPKRRTRVRDDNPQWETPLTLKLRRAKTRAYKTGKRSYKFLSKTLSRLIATNKRRHINRSINNISKGSGKWWKSVSTIIGSKKKPTPSRHLIDSKWQDNITFANNINHYFTTLGGQRLDTPTLVQKEYTANVSIGEVKRHLKHLDCKKATHSYDYPAFVSRDFAEDIALPLTDIINTMFSTQVYPSKYKQAEVTPLPKTGNAMTYKDYRPISLLWHCGKVLEFFSLKS